MGEFRYCKLFYPDDGETMLIEVGNDNWSVRIVSIYQDGSCGYATEDTAYNTFLPEGEFPTIKDFYESGEYDTNLCDYSEITEQEFLNAWNQAIQFNT